MQHLPSDASPVRSLVVLAATLALFPSASLTAQPPESGPESIVGPVFGQAAHHDVSLPLSVIGRHRGPAPPGTEIEMPLMRLNRTYPPNVTGGPDPLRQTEQRPHPEAAMTPSPTMNFEGLNNIDGFLPPDTNGDVGVNYYLQWVNTSFEVFDKATGNAVAGGPYNGDSLWAGFGGACGSPGDSPACACQETNDGDPIALYDHLAGRWLMSQFAANYGVQCVALSTTGDPLGTYDRWAFEVSPGDLNDYPKIGLMPEAYYLTTRDFPSTDGDFAGFTAFDRQAMLSGGVATFIKFSLACPTNNCVDGVQPPHLEGPAPPTGTHGFFTKTWDDDNEGDGTGVDGYRMWEMVPDFATPGNSTFAELPIVPAGADFNTNLCGGSRDCIPQPPVGSQSEIDRCLDFGIGCPTLDGFADLQMYRAQYRHWGSYDTLVISNGVDADGNDTSGVRWAELRDTGPGGSWIVHQDGTYAPADGENRWMSSIAMDKDGNIALGYSLSSLDTFPSIRYVTRETADPLGTLPGGEVELIAGTGSQTSNSHRWGDYSSMSVDPTDDCTFWYTQEYIQTTGGASWRTRIGAFKIPTCVVASISANPDSHDFGATEISSSATPLSITITNDVASPIDITSIALTNSTDFSLDTSPAADPCGSVPFTLAGSDSCNVEVTFAPQSQALFSEALDVTTAQTGVSDSVALSGTGYSPCPYNNAETLTGTASGTVSVRACQSVTIGPYDFTGGTLAVTAGKQIEALNGTSMANSVELAIDSFLALP